MRRYLAVIMSVCMIMTFLTGCGSEKEAETTTKASETVTETATEASVEDPSSEITWDKKIDIHAPEKVDQTSEPEEGETVAIIHVKNYGDICVKFFYEDSPLAVENFLTLAANGYYDGIIFHRVIQNFMIQGGDQTGTGTGGSSMWGKDFENEYSDRLAQINGSLAMARTSELDTNGSQFFINDNPQLTEADLAQYSLSDELEKMYKEHGGNPYLQDLYTVFGQVYEGMDVVDAIAASATDTTDRPVVDIVIESIDVTEYSKQ